MMCWSQSPITSCFLAQGPVTRAKSKTRGSMMGCPQLIPTLTPCQGAALGASSKQAKDTFLNMVGLVEASIEIQADNVLSHEMAEKISTALNHSSYHDDPNRDPYYSSEQWEKRSHEYKVLHDKYYDSTIMGQEVPSKTLTQSEDLIEQGCQCAAHTSGYDWVYKLIDIPEPLTDDWGDKLSATLLPIIFEAAGLPSLDVESVRQGSPLTVHFALQMPSGESCLFTGWPDFSITRRFTPIAERRIAKCFTRKARLHGVGETKSKTEAFSEAGVYGVGQLAHSL